MMWNQIASGCLLSLETPLALRPLQWLAISLAKCTLFPMWKEKKLVASDKLIYRRIHVSQETKSMTCGTND